MQPLSIEIHRPTLDTTPNLESNRFVPTKDQTDAIDQIIASLEGNLHAAKAAADSIPVIEDQLAAARILRAKLTGNKPILSASPTALAPTNGNGNDSGVKIVRARDVGDLTYIFLRDNCPGSTALELHLKMTKSGASVGKSNYLYTILKKLEEHGFVRYEVDERGTRHYFAIERDDDARIHIHAKTGNRMIP